MDNRLARLIMDNSHDTEWCVLLRYELIAQDRDQRFKTEEGFCRLLEDLLFQIVRGWENIPTAFLEKLLFNALNILFLLVHRHPEFREVLFRPVQELTWVADELGGEYRGFNLADLIEDAYRAVCGTTQSRAA